MNERLFVQILSLAVDLSSLLLFLPVPTTSSSISILELQLLTITSWQGVSIDKGALEDKIRVDQDDDKVDDEEAMNDEVIDVESQEMLK